MSSAASVIIAGTQLVPEVRITSLQPVAGVCGAKPTEERA